MELLILVIVVLLIVMVLQWSKFISLLDDKNDKIAKMRDINHELVAKLVEAKNELRTIKMLLGK